MESSCQTESWYKDIFWTVNCLSVLGLIEITFNWHISFFLSANFWSIIYISKGSIDIILLVFLIAAHKTMRWEFRSSFFVGIKEGPSIIVTHGFSPLISDLFSLRHDYVWLSEQYACLLFFSVVIALKK